MPKPDPKMNAARILDRAQVPYETKTYAEILLACIPADAELDMKVLGNHSGGKKSDLVPVPDLPKLTGYVR